MIDFNNDALDRIAETLTPLIGSQVRAYGCLPDGTDYTFGELAKVEVAKPEEDRGAYITIEVPFGGDTKRLHAFTEVHRLLIDQ